MFELPDYQSEKGTFSSFLVKFDRAAFIGLNLEVSKTLKKQEGEKSL